jgi:hypothetical protein
MSIAKGSERLRFTCVLDVIYPLFAEKRNENSFHVSNAGHRGNLNFFFPS